MAPLADMQLVALAAVFAFVLLMGIFLGLALFEWRDERALRRIRADLPPTSLPLLPSSRPLSPFHLPLSAASCARCGAAPLIPVYVVGQGSQRLCEACGAHTDPFGHLTAPPANGPGADLVLGARARASTGRRAPVLPPAQYGPARQVAVGPMAGARRQGRRR